MQRPLKGASAGQTVWRRNHCTDCGPKAHRLLPDAIRFYPKSESLPAVVVWYSTSAGAWLCVESIHWPTMNASSGLLMPSMSLALFISFLRTSAARYTAAAFSAAAE